MFCYGNDESYSTDQDHWFVFLIDKTVYVFDFAF